MQQHPYVSDSEVQNLTGLFGGESLELAEQERTALVCRQFSEAVLNCRGGLACRQRPIGIDRRPDPVSGRIEPRLPVAIDRIVSLLFRAHPPSLFRLPEENAVQPGVDGGSPFEPIEGRDERQKDLLHEILSLLDRVAETAGGAVEAGAVLVNDSVEDLFVASPERGDLSRWEGHADIIGGTRQRERAARRRPAAL